MADQERLEVRPGFVKPITKAQDIVDVVQHAMEVLQTGRTAGVQLTFDELASVLEFFGEDVLEDEDDD